MDIIYAWLASIASGFSPIIVKASSKSLVKSPWMFNILWIGFSVPLVAGLALINGAGLPHDWLSIVMLAASQAVYFLLFTYSLFKLDVTTVVPLYSLRTVFAIFLGLFFLHETITPLGLILSFVIVIMSPLAAYDEKLKLKSFFKPELAIVVIAMLALALMGLATNVAVARNGYWTSLLWQDGLTFLMLLPTIFAVKSPDRKISLKKLTPFIMLGVSSLIFNLASTAAYAHNLALSSVIVSLPLSMIFAFVLSKRYSQFLEKHSGKVYAVRFSGAFIMVVCAIWLSFLR